MSTLFSKLVELYQDVSFDEDSGYALYHIENEKGLKLIEELTSQTNQPLTRVELVTGSLTVGSEIKISKRSPSATLGFVYKSFPEFVKGDFSRVLSKSSKPYYINSMGYFSEVDVPPQKVVNYIAIKKLLKIMATMSVYTDTANKKLIFFSKHTFELTYDITNNIDDMVAVVTDMTVSTLNTINALCEWLIDEDNSKQVNQKKAILAFVLNEIDEPDQSLTFFDVIYNVKSLYKEARAQFDLYLEDYKYEKFVKKLEDNSEKFVDRVNESVSKVLTQVLGLPIAAVIPALLKGSNLKIAPTGQMIIAVAIIAYAVICYFALVVQKEVLKNVSYKVDNFETKSKVPKSLETQWQEDKRHIKILINKQTYLYYVMVFIISSVIIYGVIKFLNALYG